MRDLIDLIEDQSTTPEPVLVGNVDVPGLAQLLSKVTDVASLQTAFTNMKQGTDLTPQQKQQLGLAFISLLDADQETRRAVLTKIQNVQLSTPLTQVAGTPVTEVDLGGEVEGEIINDLDAHDFKTKQTDLFPELPDADVRVPKGFEQVGRLGDMFVLKGDRHKFGDTTYVFVKSGKVVAWLSEKAPDRDQKIWDIERSYVGVQVDGIYVDEGSRGSGLALRMFDWMLRNVCDYIVSDDQHTKGGEALWRKMLNSNKFDVLVYDSRTSRSRRRWAGKDFTAIYNRDDLVPWVTLKGKSADLMTETD